VTFAIQALLGVALLAAPSFHATAQGPAGHAGTSKPLDGPAYPLKASANNRYLVDQNNTPFLMVGDSPQQLITNLSPQAAADFMANRRSYGINTLWINLLCIFAHASCNTDARTVDGIVPFTVPGDLATPNPAYFQRVDDILAIAARHGMVVLLVPVETISWLDILRRNGASKAFAYGQYVGRRYKDVPNIVWMHGNDFQSWRDEASRAVVQAVARGIRSVDGNHIHTVELDYLTSGSLDDPSWAPLIELSAAYTYYPTYAQVLTEYNRRDFKPVFMVEANYEFEQNFSVGGGSTHNLRRQEYWTMLSGAAGQLYASEHTWQLTDGWQSSLDTPGVVQLKYMKDLFAPRKWYDLIPDQKHEVVTAGYDAVSCFAGRMAARIGRSGGLLENVLNRFRHYAFLASNACATAASTPDGSLAIAYLPSLRTVTVDMSKLASTTTARWYDPTSGEYLHVQGSPFINRGNRRFRPPGSNSTGEDDWVLVLEVQTAR
jgi:hypothetical protein